MQKGELLQLAQRYRCQGNNLAMASLIYKEVIRRFPATEEATFARIQLAAIQGSSCSSTLVILPFPLDGVRLRQGGAEHIDLGSRRYKIHLPRGMDIGHRVRLRNAAHHLDPLLNGDIHLLIQRKSEAAYQIRRDVQIDCPIDFDVERGTLKRVVLDGFTLNISIPTHVAVGQKILLKNKGEMINEGFPGDIILRLVPIQRPVWRLSGFFSRFDVWGPDKFTAKYIFPFIFEMGAEWDLKKVNASVYFQS